MKVKRLVLKHISENRWQYLIILIVFITGIFLGNYRVPGLEGGVKNHLLSLVDNYLQANMEGSFSNHNIFLSSLANQSKTVLAMWFLGLTVIGLPLVLGVVFLRGFSLGFTLGFLIREKAGGGIIISLVSILPQNIVYIPFILIWAAIAVNFSLYLIRGSHTMQQPLLKALLVYTILMAVFILILMIGSFIEAYLSPWLLNLLLKI